MGTISRTLSILYLDDPKSKINHKEFSSFAAMIGACIWFQLIYARTNGNFHHEFDVTGRYFRSAKRENDKRQINWEDADCVIYVVSASDYDQKCSEDEKTNRIEDAITTFGEILGSTHKAQIMLFLNKIDIFEEKFSKVPLKDFFPQFSGSTTQDGAMFLVELFRQKASPEKDIILIQY
jgi:hypothetical protein